MSAPSPSRCCGRRLLVKLAYIFIGGMLTEEYLKSGSFPMSTNSKTEQIWNGAIEFATPAPDPFLAAIKEQLTKFREHKEVLLSHLENAYDRSPKAEPFDKDKSWSQIETVAYIHYSERRIRQQAMGAGERRTRHREIADVLTRARSMIEDAMRSPDLADDLIGSWWQGTTEYAEAGGRFVDLKREFEKVTKGLAVLEEAAVRASNGAQQGPRATERKLSIVVRVHPSAGRCVSEIVLD
jgi:hypothetical protein